MTIDRFLQGYLECALWSSNDNDELPLDDNYTIEDFTEESIIRADQDCKLFRHLAGDLLREAYNKGHDESNQGHDFWLTRCGHGVGFWDRDLDELGDKLTEVCAKFGDAHIYVGDMGDVKLHYEMG